MGLLPSLLRKAGRRAGITSTSTPAKSQLVLDGKTLGVTLRFNARAKRIILRLDKHGEGIVLTVPSGTSHSKAMEFAASQGAWIWQQLAKQPDHIELIVGATIPVRGIPHRIATHHGRRTPVWCEMPKVNTDEGNMDESDADECLVDGTAVLFVSGDEQHHPRRIKDWLKKQARADLTHAAFSYADKMDGKITRISIRDTSSRWGSCSSNGSLSFSWRLIFAPEFVLDYVAAHEVAHLLEMNHSAQFWRLVEDHCPTTKAAKSWLKANGRSLHRYGA